ncbi:beta-carotene isomerase D27, chloroplastic isoform X2 [Typha latifolia]|uniref:beta-carotene isomerase D27, chloroplastic isoform X2 n=1 Tax=Typha latifolia TaxID=4733 RepID=UPI003C2C57FF
MGALLVMRITSLPFSSRSPFQRRERFRRNRISRIPCSPSRSEAMDESRTEYKPGFLDDLFLTFFREKMVEVRVLESLFPPLILVLFKMLIAPIYGGRIASMMVARATALSCQWLMGPCSVNSIILPDGSSCASGVLVEKCKYLEESKCVGICINTCKLPTQTFFKDYMGVPLHMEPNFTDYSCQFNFGVLPPASVTDKALTEPCLEICPNANRRRELGRGDTAKCPQA